MASEEQLIERVQRRFPAARGGLRVGIGDDAAVVFTGGRKDSVITTDQFLENVHFLRKIHAPKVVGYKALARATSDIAAMGARARYFFLTIGLPTACTGKWFDEFLAGMSGAARRFELALAGGDTTKYPSIVISLTVLGEVNRGRAILRSGARPGDLLYVSGVLGEAELGWQMIKKKLHTRSIWAPLTNKHFQPQPRLELGQWLARRGCATAMIDTSDGLSTDLGRLCKASGVGAVVWANKLPVAAVPRRLRRFGFDPLSLALRGGEDYELLFTVSRKDASRLPSKAGGVPISVVGEITQEKSVDLVGVDGDRKPLKPAGWDPFR